MSAVAPELAGSSSIVAELLRTSPMAVAVFDRELRYVAHNEAWLMLHGEDTDRVLLGRRHEELFPVPEEWHAVTARCLAGEAMVTRAVALYDRSEGRSEHVRWLLSPWRGPDASILGLIVYAEPLTEQIKIEQRLAERESLIRDLFEQAPIGLNLCRLDGLWVESNPAFLDIIGYTQTEADGGLTYWQLTPRKYDTAEAEQLEQLRKQRRYGPYEKEFIRKDGTLVPVRLNGFLVAREGMEYIWSLIEDLTEQRELESRLEEERLTAIQASKLAGLGELSASIAHEINNPLEIIDAYAFSLRDAIDQRDEPFIQEALAAVRDAVSRAGKIVHGLRKFARATGGDPTTDAPITVVVQDALDLCRARVRTHGVKLDVELETTAQLRCHPIELSQVIVNLLNNAFDAAVTSEGKWIRLRAIDVADGGVEISVEDSGPGVPAHLREAIFRPFFTTKAVGVGTGLGLSISRSIIERHGGRLTLDTAAPHTRLVVALST